MHIESKSMFKHLTKDTYHYLLTCSWPIFFSLLIFLFLLVNTLFGFIFTLSAESFHIPPHLQDSHPFIASLFLSVQTMSTIGYGGLLPTSVTGELIAASESLIGLMFTALSTGIIFARLSQPSAQILFADIALHTLTDRGPALVFRIANARGNDIINARATLSVLQLNRRSQRMRMVHIEELKLRRDHSPTFYLNWILIHDLTEESPLAGYGIEELSQPTLIFILNITGHDSSFNDTVFQYRRYRGTEIRHNVYFKDMVFNDEQGETSIDLNALSSVEEWRDPESR